MDDTRETTRRALLAAIAVGYGAVGGLVRGAV